MLKKLLFCLIAIVVISPKLFSQVGAVHVNRVFQVSSGSPVFTPVLAPFNIKWTKSITNGSGEVITVGHTSVTGQGENLYVEKRNASGVLIFQASKNTFSTSNEYATDVKEDPISGDIYVVGITDNGGTGGYDAIGYKFDSSGSSLDSLNYDGPGNLNDIATSIIVSGGNVFMAGSTESSANDFDYLLVKFNNNLGFMAHNFYNYNGNGDYGIGVETNTVSNKISVIGASQSSTASCEYAIAVFNASNLNYDSEVRSSIPGTAVDQPSAYCKDVSGNLYLTGKAYAIGTGFNIKTIKITPTYSIAWTATLDAQSLDDAGTSIATDASGNVFVGGYITKTNNLTDLICLKLSSSNGSTIWQHKQSAIDISGNAAIKKIFTNSVGDIYFTGVEKGLSGYKQVLNAKIKSNGNLIWQRNVLSSTSDILPSDILIENDDIFVISVLDSLTDSYLTTKYSELERDTARLYSNGGPCGKKNELIVSFLPSVVKKNAIDNQIGTKIMEFGDIDDFIQSTASAAIDNAFEEICEIKVIKIYTDLKTTDTVAVSRLGESVPVPSFWSTLLLKFPNSITIQQAADALATIPNVVSFAHPNYIISQVLSLPNDSLYNIQGSLHQMTGSSNVHINVEEAWSIAQSCGSSHIRGGIFDTGIHWQHKDFGFNGNPTSGKIEGWFFPTQSAPFNMNIRSHGNPDPHGHGSQMAGIIGAERNNTSGVAGIAGGDGTNGNPGVSLFSLGIIYSDMSYWLDALLATSGGGQVKPYSYNLNFSNHSYELTSIWWSSGNIDAYRDQVHFANRMKVTFVAARGSNGINNPIFPANFDTSWVISVGGADTLGLKWSTSSYGSGMDVIAPANGYCFSTHNDGYYHVAGGTSGAAAHVSGVVGLLMSYMNDSLPHYKNLAPEDCDFIIQRSATNIGPPGLDSLTGYGLLNAGKALRMVEKPFRILYHYGTNSQFPYTLHKTVYSNSDTVILTEAYKNLETPKVSFPKAKYVVKTFSVSANVNHIYTYPTDSLMYFWPRHSSSFVFDLFNAQKRLDLHERVKINSCNGGGATLSGFVYQVWDSTGLGSPLGWWPCDTTFSALYSGTNTPNTLMEYSVLTKNKAVGIDEYEEVTQSINVFPNPANHQQIISFDSDLETNCTIELYDLMGRFIKTVYKGRTEIGTNKIKHDIENLPNSMYIYIIKISNKVLTKKFIKE